MPRSARRSQRTPVAVSVVFNLRTQEEKTYTLPARQALVAAWYQAQGNFNTWQYDESKVPIERGKRHLYAGDLAVRATS